MPENYCCDAANAAQILSWLKGRNGILIWESASLSDPGASITTPFLTAGGETARKPSWKMKDQPTRHITDVAEVDVTTAKEVKRFKVGLRMSGTGLAIKVTDAGSRRIRREVEKAKEKYGKPAWYEFDYESEKNAVILIEDARIPLSQYATDHGL